jgi:hypothetical protein
METLWQDLRFELRSLAKSRGLTAVAVLSLALGIGANVTIFTFLNGLLLRPTAVADPARLVELWQHNTTRGNDIGSHLQLSFPDYVYCRDHNRVFSDMGAFTAETSSVTWNRASEGEMLHAALVSANFLLTAIVTGIALRARAGGSAIEVQSGFESEGGFLSRGSGAIETP